MLIVGVTACPTGIAHTFMAAESLQRAIEAAGYEAKIETQGADGSANVITEEDCKRAVACIVAAEVKIKNGSRFDNIPTLECGVEEAIKDAKGLVQEVLEAIK